MESALEEQLDKALEVPNVVGVIAADTQGLCLGHRGEGKPELSGQVASLCQSANMLIKNPQVCCDETTSVSYQNFNF